MIPDDEVLFESVPELGERLRDGEFTSYELTLAYIDRLIRVGPTLNAVQQITWDRALEAAQRADRELAEGTDRGPLHGIPYGLKDLIAFEGYKTTWGANPYREQEFDYDATIVERLNEAGAVPIAKLANVELAGGMGYSPETMTFTGKGHNPWAPDDEDAWSGGSSSGSGQAPAAGLVGFAIGTETWGSIFSPSINNGLTGLRPTYGVVSRYGVMALSYTMDKIGPMCRSAEGAQAVFDAISGPDPNDHTVSDRLELLEELSLSDPPQLAVLDADPDDENFRQSLDTLEEFAEIEVIELPDLPAATAAATILFAEAGSIFNDLIASGDVQTLTDPEGSIGGYAYETILAKDYITALRIRKQVQEAIDEALEPYDALVTDGRPISGVTNLCGLPGITMPNGFRDNGVPTSLVFTGRAFDDNKLFELAQEYQSRTNHIDYTEIMNRLGADSFDRELEAS
ncbi:Asp-tRNAAsn/Glu-tRNAGln amidotransferase A subunit or related amidase [Halapricum desulfuricans]|uniref:Asp-tRNAAsn/Glu-tRNAGln amidotransferase A subunit or related amidase n=1 Tax=Halapricum desulfuricans TaxID=2841257 RepID=A0A897N7Y5_9EURY|nr:amidase [Halapricum desulfuricans]QSG10510.1 Asp-tRNAAsn/Glu-tRNAGln amidotransferase A subunit or related amidase [Halapricum desulfuricans]